jgi:hypothetical protein
VSELDRNRIPRRNEELVWRTGEEMAGDEPESPGVGEVFICSPDGETLYTLSDVGADTWRACDGQHTVGEILDQLRAVYDVESEVLERDLAAFLADLEERDLLLFD